MKILQRFTLTETTGVRAMQGKQAKLGSATTWFGYGLNVTAHEYLGRGVANDKYMAEHSL